MVWELSGKEKRFDWAAADGGVTRGGLRGVWPPFLEIWEIQKTQEKGLLPQITLDLLRPLSLQPLFAAPQFESSLALMSKLFGTYCDV